MWCPCGRNPNRRSAQQFRAAKWGRRFRLPTQFSRRSRSSRCPLSYCPTVRFFARRDDSPGGVPLRPPLPLRSTCPMGRGSTVSPTVFWFSLRFLCALGASALRNPAPRDLTLQPRPPFRCDLPPCGAGWVPARPPARLSTPPPRWIRFPPYRARSILRKMPSGSATAARVIASARSCVSATA